LLGPRAGADDLAAGGDHGQAEHVLAHRAVAHRVGAAGARGRHAAEAGVGARVDREEQALVADLAVELLARDAGLHGDRQVLGVDAQQRFMRDTSTLTPPCTASRWPSSEEPTP
jgi:hypothetical protein